LDFGWISVNSVQGAILPRYEEKTQMTNASAPTRTTTGTGATPTEIAADVAAMLRSQTKDQLIWDKWWDNDRITSIEGDGSTWTGREALNAKSAAWEAENDVTGFEIKGPFVGATGFSMHYTVSITNKATGKKMDMTEVAVYTVENGKVIREEFMYSHEGG